MGGCPEGIVQHGLYKVLPANVGVFFFPERTIQHELYGVLQPLWVVAGKKVSNTVLTFRVEHFTWSWESFERSFRRGGYLEGVGWVGKGMF